MDDRSGLEDIYATTLRVFTDSDEPTAPRTTPEIAAELDCGRRGTHKRLQHLADEEVLRTKKVGAGARVWWYPVDTRGRRHLRELLTNAEGLGDVGAWEYDIDDEERWVRVSGEAVSEDGHETVRGSFQDITAQKQHERRLETQRADLEVLNGLNAVVRELTDTVIEKSTRTQIEETTCAQLAGAELYRFAWIATVDPVTLDLVQRAQHGCAGYLADADLTSNPTEPGGKGPAGRAVRTQEMQFSRDVYDDPDFEPWLDLADRYGYRSMAVIPIVFEGTLYGVLGIYSERVDAFGAAERKVLEGIGEIIGHAIAAIERKQALLSDEVVELAFRLENTDSRIGLPSSFEASLEFDSTLSLGGGVFLVYCTATDVDRESLEALDDSDRLEHIETVRVVGETDDGYELEVEMVDPPILSTVTGLGGYVSNVTIADANTTMTVHIPADQDVSGAIDRIASVGPGVEMLRRRQTTRPVRTADRRLQWLPDSLTDRQRAVLEAAYFMGYFGWPRERSGPEVADRLGVSSSTFHQHLRKAEAKLLDAVFE